MATVLPTVSSCSPICNFSSYNHYENITFTVCLFFQKQNVMKVEKINLLERCDLCFPLNYVSLYNLKRLKITTHVAYN